MSEARPVVAAFDFDGTLTTRDTLTPFLRLVVGRRRFALALLRTAPALASAWRRRDLRDDAKERLLQKTLTGRRVDELRAVGTRYAPTIELRDDIIAKLRAHQAAGHETLVISASPALYVEAAAAHLGIDAFVATDLEAIDGVLTGRYAGRNCRAAEKLARLQIWLGGRDVELHAYGNSPDDDLMLARADHAERV